MAMQLPQLSPWGWIALLVSVVIVILIAIKSTRNAIINFFKNLFKNLFNNKVCKPTDAERATAGGVGVLTFTTDSSGNCVASTCNTANNYNLYQGVCYPCSGGDNVKVTIPDGYSAIYDNTTEQSIAQMTRYCLIYGEQEDPVSNLVMIVTLQRTKNVYAYHRINFFILFNYK